VVEVRGIGTFFGTVRLLLYCFAFVPAATALDGGGAFPPSLLVTLFDCCFFAGAIVVFIYLLECWLFPWFERIV
jgi:hypothetical protein